MTATSRPLLAGAVPAALVLLATTSCGGGAPGSSASASVASSPPAATPTQPSGRPATVVLTRTGGLAGFADRLDIAPDGTVTGSTRAGEVACRIDGVLATTLVSGPAPTPSPAVGADRVTVTLDRLGITSVLGEAQGADALSEAARSLLDDVQQPEDARTVCR